MNNIPAIELKNVNFYYGDLTVLDDVSLTVGGRDFLGIIGPNGGGKTTLLKIILGLLKPAQGEVRILGCSPREGRRKIGYVPQAMNFDTGFPINVFDVVLMGNLTRRGFGSHYTLEDKERTAFALEQVGLSDLAQRPIGQLSQGQKQRAFIARALVAEPQLLLLDEPTAGVDPAIERDFYSLMVKLNQRMPIVLVSHDIGVISSCVTKIACLNRQLHYHDAKEISQDDLNKTYGCCHVEMIAHGVPHRVLKEHK